MAWIYFSGITEEFDPAVSKVKCDILLGSKPDHGFPNVKALSSSLSYMI